MRTWGDGSRTGFLAMLSVVAVVAFVLLPRQLTGGPLAEPEVLSRTFVAGFEQFWQRGVVDRDLARAVDFWSTYHLYKALFAALLAGVLFWLARRLFDVGVGSAGVRKAAAWLGLVVASAAGTFSVLLVMANVQGMLAPFAALFPRLAPYDVADDVRASLTAGTGDASADMLADFSRFHLVLAVCAVVAALGFVVLAIAVLRRDRGPRRTLATAAITVSVLLGLIAVVNVITALQPVPALLGAL